MASAVGLASIEIFGYRDPRTRDYAVELGVALQLTNILRDVAADAAPRPAVPARWTSWRRFGVDGGEVLAAAAARRAPRRGLRALLGFQARAGARALRARARRCCPPADRRAHGSRPRSWRAVYRALLEELVAPRASRSAAARVRPLAPAQGLDRAARTLAARRAGRVKVVVVGGGFAGLAAAIALQERRHEVTLLERRGVLGGRATSYRDAVDAARTWTTARTS